MADRAVVLSGAPAAWARLKMFGPRDWILLAEASLTLALSHAALKWRSPAHVIARATRTRTARPASFTAKQQQRVQWIVGVASRHVVRVPCLSQSVALARVLARRGVGTQVRVGVRTTDGRLDAHAWVEWNGRPVNDDADHVAQYRALEPYRKDLGSRFRAEGKREFPSREPPVSLPLENDSRGPVAGDRDVLAAIVRGDDVSADVWRTTNVEAFCAAADHHGVLPLVADRLRSMTPAPPDDLATAVGDRARAYAAGDLMAEHELRSVVTALHAAGVDPILFKGAHLAYVEYARPDLRPRVDTDVLIPSAPEARRIAHDVLTGLGYDSPLHAGGEFVMTQRSYVKKDLSRGPSGRVVHAVDVHWRIANPQIFSRVLSHDEVARAAVPIPGIGPAARGPSRPHALFIACVHRVAHHADSDALIWLVDIDRLARRQDDHDWTQFLALARERQVLAVCGRSLQRAAGTFRTPLPDRVRDAIGQRAGRGAEASAAFLDGPRAGARAALGDLRALGSFRDRARFVRELLVPPPAYMRRVYAPGSQAPLAWLYLARLTKDLGSRFRAEGKRGFP